MNNNLDNELVEETPGDEGSMAFCAPPSRTAEYPGALTTTHQVIRRLDRDTTLIATGLLGTVIFAAIALALLERAPKGDQLAEESWQTAGQLLLNTNPAAPSNVIGLNGKSPGELAWGQPTCADQEFDTEINDPDVQANATSRSPPHGPDSAKIIRPKIAKVRYRSSGRPEDVKARLIALWHQSLKRREK